MLANCSLRYSIHACKLYKCIHTYTASGKTSSFKLVVSNYICTVSYIASRPPLHNTITSSNVQPLTPSFKDYNCNARDSNDGWRKVRVARLKMHKNHKGGGCLTVLSSFQLCDNLLLARSLCDDAARLAVGNAALLLPVLRLCHLPPQLCCLQST